MWLINSQIQTTVEQRLFTSWSYLLLSLSLCVFGSKGGMCPFVTAWLLPSLPLSFLSLSPVPHFSPFLPSLKLHHVFLVPYSNHGFVVQLLIFSYSFQLPFFLLKEFFKLCPQSSPWCFSAHYYLLCLALNPFDSVLTTLTSCQDSDPPFSRSPAQVIL